MRRETTSVLSPNALRLFGIAALLALLMLPACTSDNPSPGTLDGARDGAADGAPADGQTSEGLASDARDGRASDAAIADAIADAFLSDAPTDRPLGSVCTSAAQCVSGFCADGTCCASACNGACRRCDSAGARGRCVPTAPGDKPVAGKTCNATAKTACGNDGTCNGRGDCTRWAAGTECQAAQCSTQNPGELDLAHFCDGDGKCEAAGSFNCQPYACDSANARCYSSCSPASSSSQCRQGQQCVNGQCGGSNAGLPFGAACTGANQCASGKCSGGVCCDADCNGDCESCSVPGAVGKCLAVADGAAPIDTGKSCPAASASAPCGFDGKCDGRRHCRVAPEGTSCGAASCVDGSERSRLTTQRCNGSRQQPSCQSETDGCGNYRCEAGGMACRQSCSSDPHCRVGRWCVSNQCVECRNNGDCGPNGTCTNGECNN